MMNHGWRVTAAQRSGRRVGYVRVSSLDQKTDRQLEDVESDKRFVDKGSNKNYGLLVQEQHRCAVAQ